MSYLSSIHVLLIVGHACLSLERVTIICRIQPRLCAQMRPIYQRLKTHILSESNKIARVLYNIFEHISDSAETWYADASHHAEVQGQHLIEIRYN